MKKPPALLEPWLGKGNAQSFLTIPALIDVKVTPALRADLNPLRQRLAAAAPGANLDDHATWHNRLAMAAQLRPGARRPRVLACHGRGLRRFDVCSAGRSRANHEIVSVLHLVGATDEFIAAEVQRRFFVLGFRGAVAGMLAAFAALAGAAFLLDRGVGADSFLPQFTIGGWHALWLFTVPLATCLVTAYTARLTVLKTLRNQY